MLGAGSMPRSNTGGRKDPACSVTSGIPASLVDSSAVRVQPGQRSELANYYPGISLRNAAAFAKSGLGPGTFSQ